MCTPLHRKAFCVHNFCAFILYSGVHTECCHLVLCYRSTNTQCKNAAASGFSFRLEERAEKRKEVTNFHRGIVLTSRCMSVSVLY